MSTPKSFKTVEIEQQIRFGFTLEKIGEVLKDWSSVRDYAYIMHDKDENVDGDPVEPHCHLMLRFKDSVPTTAILNKWKNADVQLAENNLEKCKRWESAVAYLTHANAEEKHQYNDSDVVSNFDFIKVKNLEVERKQSFRNAHRANEITNAIVRGEIKEYNLHNFISPVEYNTYKRDIENAKKYRKDMLKSEMGREDRGMKVVFISGPSGCGKDVYANQMASDKHLSVYRTSNSKNPFDDYQGQECIIWSDARDNEKKPQEILRLFDNHQNATEHARYLNIILECKLMIVTSIKPIQEWYLNAYEDRKEDRKQLYRRVLMHAKMNYETIKYEVYDEEKEIYVEQDLELPNVYCQRYLEKRLNTKEKQLDALGDMFKNVGDYLEKHKDDIIKYAEQNKENDGFMTMKENEKLPWEDND